MKRLLVIGSGLLLGAFLFLAAAASSALAQGGNGGDNCTSCTGGTGSGGTSGGTGTVHYNFSVSANNGQFSPPTGVPAGSYPNLNDTKWLDPATGNIYSSSGTLVDHADGTAGGGTGGAPGNGFGLGASGTTTSGADYTIVR